MRSSWIRVALNSGTHVFIRGRKGDTGSEEKLERCGHQPRALEPRSWRGTRSPLARTPCSPSFDRQNCERLDLLTVLGHPEVFCYSCDSEITHQENTRRHRCSGSRGHGTGRVVCASPGSGQALLGRVSYGKAGPDSFCRRRNSVSI